MPPPPTLIFLVDTHTHTHNTPHTRTRTRTHTHAHPHPHAPTPTRALTHAYTCRERIRGFLLEVQEAAAVSASPSATGGSAGGAEWITVLQGTAVGHKRIVMLPKPMVLNAARFTLTEAAGVSVSASDVAAGAPAFTATTTATATTATGALDGTVGERTTTTTMPTATTATTKTAALTRFASYAAQDCALPPAPPAPPCELLDTYKYLGVPIGPASSGASTGSCCTNCKQNPKCVGFTVSAAGSCQLLSAIGGGVQSPSYTSGSPVRL